ncbi:MAG: hypothetical protein H0V30_12860 [Chitinophagaceae bacterium]|jgi:ABC-type dipeptide/oligopeptide/nickel transport system permease subunit|nr:hypothetical protein [Chitinophagaceae bacterium]
MPESRKRKIPPKLKPSEVPASQRVRGRIIWSLLLAVFGIIIAFFAVGLNYIALTIGALIGAIAGYFIGIQMVRDLSEK